MTYVYVGTLNWGADSARGLYTFTLDDADGRLRELETVPLLDPTFVVVSPSRGILYAVTASATFEGEAGAGLVSFSIDRASGRLKRLNHQVIPSPFPSYLSLDRAERFLLVANGFGGTASVFPIGDDGRIGEIADLVRLPGEPSVRLGETPVPPFPIAPGAPHPHCIRTSPDNRFVVVSDMPNSRLQVFGFDAQRGKLSGAASVASPPDGRRHGARHFEWSPGGRHLYVVNERVNSGTVFAYHAQDAGLEPVQTFSAVPDPSDQQENLTADIHVHSSGRFMLLSNRGHDSIAVYAIDDDTGAVRPVAWEPCLGHRPRVAVFTPDGRLVLVGNNSSDEVVAFWMNQETGRLTPTGTRVTVPRPSSIAFFAS